MQPGGDASTVHAPDILQLATPTQFQLQRHERPHQAATLATRTAQHRAHAALRGEEVHQRAGFLVGTAVQHVGWLADRLFHGRSLAPCGSVKLHIGAALQPIAGKPAPTGTAHGLKSMRSGWEPACRRWAAPRPQ
ncbi:hypothetical protein D3C75_886210 [compost metagenome]